MRGVNSTGDTELRLSVYYTTDSITRCTKAAKRMTDATFFELLIQKYDSSCNASEVQSADIRFESPLKFKLFTLGFIFSSDLPENGLVR